MAIKEELRPARTLNVTKVVKTDWSKVELISEEVPLLCSLSKKFLGLVRQCQAESFAEELRRLQKKKNLYSTSSLLTLAPILGKDVPFRLGGRAGLVRLLYDQLLPPFLPGPHLLAEKIVHAFYEKSRTLTTSAQTFFSATFVNTSGYPKAENR